MLIMFGFDDYTKEIELIIKNLAFTMLDVNIPKSYSKLKWVSELSHNLSSGVVGTILGIIMKVVFDKIIILVFRYGILLIFI